MFRIGRTTVEKIDEMVLNGMKLDQLLPDLNPETLKQHPTYLPEGTSDREGHAFMSVHAWLVRHNGLNILIDTGAGNDKSRPQQAMLDHLTNPFLERLAAAGVAPEDIDFILHTHIHSDHVGWNTRWEQGRWVPTFVNAEVIVSDLEWRYAQALASNDSREITAARRLAGLGEPVGAPVSGTFDDSIEPLQGQVKIRRIAIDGREVLPGIRFISTPGHSIDHASIEIVSDGKLALFSGDVFHHPVEVYLPELVSTFCEFPEATRQARRLFLEHAADTQAMVFSSHFAKSSVGQIAKGRDGFEWRFIEPLSQSEHGFAG